MARHPVCAALGHPMVRGRPSHGSCMSFTRSLEKVVAADPTAAIFLDRANSTGATMWLLRLREDGYETDPTVPFQGVPSRTIALRTFSRHAGEPASAAPATVRVRWNGERGARLTNGLNGPEGNWTPARHRASKSAPSSGPAIAGCTLRARSLS